MYIFLESEENLDTYYKHIGILDGVVWKYLFKVRYSNEDTIFIKSHYLKKSLFKIVTTFDLDSEFLWK